MRAIALCDRCDSTRLQYKTGPYRGKQAEQSRPGAFGVRLGVSFEHGVLVLFCALLEKIVVNYSFTTLQRPCLINRFFIPRVRCQSNTGPRLESVRDSGRCTQGTSQAFNLLNA